MNLGYFDAALEQIARNEQQRGTRFAQSSVQIGATAQQAALTQEQLVENFRTLVPEQAQTAVLQTVQNRGMTERSQIAELMMGAIHEALRDRADLTPEQKMAYTGELRGLEHSNRPVTEQQVATAAPAIREQVEKIKDDKEKIAEQEKALAGLFVAPVAALAVATIESADKDPAAQALKVAEQTRRQQIEDELRGRRAMEQVGPLAIPVSPTALGNGLAALVEGLTLPKLAVQDMDKQAAADTNKAAPAITALDPARHRENGLG